MDAAVGSAAKAAPRRTRSKVGGLVDEAGVGYVPSGHHGDVKRQPGVLSCQASVYCAMIPPSTVRIAPVVHAASSDARWGTLHRLSHRGVRQPGFQQWRLADCGRDAVAADAVLRVMHGDRLREGMTAREKRNTPLRNASITPSQMSSPVSCSGPVCNRLPALLTSTSTRPNVARVACTAC